MEEREELIMVPFLNGISTSRKSHFLKPIINLLEPLPLNPVVQNPKDGVAFKIIIKGGCPQKNWKNWVHHLVSLHQHTWKKAGIFEAILASTYKIKKQKKLFIALAERWCIETNTFVFSWGEATVSLEDLMVLGGFSVLGKSVFEPLDGDDMIAMYNRIIAYCKMGSYYAWMKYFMGIGGEVEHVAFLILWLSRYVFPIKHNVMVKNVFPIAVHLSKGVQIALAPAVLASIYNDLGLLKRLMVAFDRNNGCEFKKDKVKFTVCSPVYFVQLWAWERFPKLRPKQCSIKYGEPRLARWENLGELKVENVRELIDSSGGSFLWKPYGVSLENWELDKWYKADESYVLVDSEMERDVEEFVRIVRVSELVGLDCVEHYAPHRVAMQFGFDQDIPGCVNRQNETPLMAWSYYNRPIESSFVYIPPKLSEASVSTRYFEWWCRQEKVGAEDSPKKRQKLSEVYCAQEVNHPSAIHNCGSSSYVTTTEDRVTIDLISSDEEDGLSISKFISLKKKQKVFEHKISGETLVQCGTLSASVSNDLVTLMDPVEVVRSDLPPTGTPKGDSVCVNVTQRLSENLDDGDCNKSNNSDVERNGLRCASQEVGTLVEDQGCEIKLSGIVTELEKLEVDIIKEIDSRLRYLEELTRGLRLKKPPDSLAGNSSQHEPVEGSQE